MSTERTRRGRLPRSRRFLLVSLLAGASLTVAAAGDPGGPQGGGYQDGRTAGVTLENSSIRLSGNGLGGSADGYRVPRPCWYEPGKSAEEMLQSQEDVKDWWIRTNPGSTAEQFDEFLKQYKDKVGQPGKWWSPAYNSADPGGMSCWAGLEGALWVPQGTTPPGGITAEELLQIARAALTVPEPTIHLNPDAKSYVNLPTWVWLDGIGATTRSVTATLPGVMSATVTATLNRTEVGSEPGAPLAETRNACGTTGKRDQSGGFTCGVKYLHSSADPSMGGKAYQLTVTTVWDVTGASTGGVVGLAFAPVEVTVERGVTVGEVQSTVRR
ncbi:hypothetical protein [Planotetraspora mira]|uniref:Enoyl reductase n=1 Tax=Planotetraspora mira TaxID=58121 RepID=A0A8J3U0L4_9ACTN|nr:hypothetical protein [Planotetraspora mira]GII34722.1 hypothetical protein Pmi06nite_81640 [Planotetraspora mira]